MNVADILKNAQKIGRARTSFSLDKNQYHDFQSICRKHGLLESRVIDQLIKRFLEECEQDGGSQN